MSQPVNSQIVVKVKFFLKLYCFNYAELYTTAHYIYTTTFFLKLQ